jgi:hypothetical protein
MTIIEQTNLENALISAMRQVGICREQLEASIESAYGRGMANPNRCRTVAIAKRCLAEALELQSKLAEQVA